MDFTYYDTVSVFPETTAVSFFQHAVGPVGYDVTNIVTPGILSTCHGFTPTTIAVHCAEGLDWSDGWAVRIFVHDLCVYERVKDLQKDFTSGTRITRPLYIPKNSRVWVHLYRVHGTSRPPEGRVKLDLIGNLHG